MSNAYVVTHGEYSGYGITGVFSTFEKARQECVDEIHVAVLKAVEEIGGADDGDLWNLNIYGPITIEVYEQDRDDLFPGEDRMFQMFPQPKEKP